MAIKSVAVIGSFRQHYDIIKNVWSRFINIGLDVTSPKGSSVIEKGIPFVRFYTDPTSWSDPMVQTVALHRIFRANFIYVVAPHGYIGRTTSYEIGRAIQARRPLYFSERPNDIPIEIPNEHVIPIERLVTVITKKCFFPKSIFVDTDISVEHEVLEQELLTNVPREDEDLIPDNIANSFDKRIVLCGSMSFYADMCKIKDTLNSSGVECIAPSADDGFFYSIGKNAYFDLKRDVSKKHIRKIRDKKTFGILVINSDKHGVNNYIGPNTFAEIAVAFAHYKKIYLLQGIPDIYREELEAWQVICLNYKIGIVISDVIEHINLDKLQPSLFDYMGDMEKFE